MQAQWGDLCRRKTTLADLEQLPQHLTRGVNKNGCSVNSGVAAPPARPGARII